MHVFNKSFPRMILITFLVLSSSLVSWSMRELSWNKSWLVSSTEVILEGYYPYSLPLLNLLLLGCLDNSLDGTAELGPRPLPASGPWTPDLLIEKLTEELILILGLSVSPEIYKMYCEQFYNLILVITRFLISWKVFHIA